MVSTVNKERRKGGLHNMDTGALHTCLVESIKPALAGACLPVYVFLRPSNTYR